MRGADELCTLCTSGAAHAKLLGPGRSMGHIPAALTNVSNSSPLLLPCLRETPCAPLCRSYIEVSPAFDVDWGRDLGNAFNFRCAGSGQQVHALLSRHRWPAVHAMPSRYVTACCTLSTAAPQVPGARDPAQHGATELTCKLPCVAVFCLCSVVQPHVKLVVCWRLHVHTLLNRGMHPDPALHPCTAGVQACVRHPVGGPKEVCAAGLRGSA